MSVRHLMTHTSGLSYGEIGDPRFEALYEAQNVMDLFPTDGRTTRDNVRNLASTCLIHQPGAQWNYSLGLDVLVAVIEVASGVSFASFVQSAVLDPLGMLDTHFVLPEEKTNRLAMVAEPSESGGWKRHEHPRYSIDYPLNPEWPLCGGGAGLTSSARDYARFLQCYLDRGAAAEGRLLSEAAVDSVMADQAAGHLDGGWHQGLAFGVREGGTSEGCFFWSGYFNTSYFADPNSNTAVVLMKQTYGVEADSTAAAFARILWN
jgi:CubicO group peptidase (beta-lactamase class C family)